MPTQYPNANKNIPAQELGCTNTMAPRRTLLERQDLIQMGADDFSEEGYHTTTGGRWVWAIPKECTRHCPHCRRARLAKQFRHISLLVRSALPDELNSMTAGGDVKETVMTIPFLLTCISNMIGDLERKFTSDGDKTRGCLPP